jgi:hypothetical protein
VHITGKDLSGNQFLFRWPEESIDDGYISGAKHPPNGIFVPTQIHSELIRFIEKLLIILLLLVLVLYPAYQKKFNQPTNS